MDISDNEGNDEQEYEQDQGSESDLADDNVCDHYCLGSLFLSSPVDECWGHHPTIQPKARC